MEKFRIKKLNANKEVLSERLYIRVAPALMNELEEVAALTNRTVAEVGRMALEWALERIEIEEEETIWD